jgi:hypothetical protein
MTAALKLIGYQTTTKNYISNEAAHENAQKTPTTFLHT